ncbi:DHDH [Mytilus edulis]|uniref:DHDH n=1 Tax=Mytilus edulis TaxID=6550 RepID=A0A8S3TSW6_MYTED|nr:DHDH [Mytilus edulis]
MATDEVKSLYTQCGKRIVAVEKYASKSEKQQYAQQIADVISAMDGYYSHHYFTLRRELKIKEDELDTLQKAIQEEAKKRNGHDINGCVILSYSKGQKACLMYSSKVKFDTNCASIRGTNGSIEINDHFLCQEEVKLPTGKGTNEILVGPVPFCYPNNGGLCYEAEEVRKCIKSDKRLFLCPAEVKLPTGKETNEIPVCPVPFNYPNSGGLCYEAEEIRRCIKGGITEYVQMVHKIMEEVARQIGRELPYGK